MTWLHRTKSKSETDLHLTSTKFCRATFDRRTLNYRKTRQSRWNLFALVEKLLHWPWTSRKSATNQKENSFIDELQRKRNISERMKPNNKRSWLNPWCCSRREDNLWDRRWWLVWFRAKQILKEEICLVKNRRRSWRDLFYLPTTKMVIVTSIQVGVSGRKKKSSLVG